MSLPPPSLPPGAQPPWSVPTAAGAPPPPRRRRRSTFLVGVVVVALLAVVGAVVVVVVSSDDGKTESSGSASVRDARRNLQALIDDADPDDGDVTELDECPLGDPNELAQVVADATGFEINMLPGEDSSVVFGEDFSSPYASCSITRSERPGPATFGFDATDQPPDDVSAFVAEVYPEFGEVDLDDPFVDRDGEIVASCIMRDDERYCEAAWLSDADDLLLTAWLGSDALDDERDIDQDDAVDALLASLDLMLRALAEPVD